MKPLTRQRLDALDARVEPLGLRRQRRGLMVVDGSAQMTQAVALQPRDWRDGLVWGQ
ncbi:hypothetical protein [Antarctobacter sp.]|uniref:hypothetical protein n=1 Tax=Antarctobacter sp. TaxID=1872577 RepID=UPI002B26FA24|nr:hypothetical protein [Antarctobacter sp.]